eukprot:m.69652 g.69652  ORF g.69652 m.69652 type:complete len:697 (-) comp14006_c0_seq1:222-2312(-)
MSVSPKKRLSVGWHLSTKAGSSTPGSPARVVVGKANDDAREKSERRRSEAARRSMHLLASPYANSPTRKRTSAGKTSLASSGKETGGTTAAGLTNTQLTDLYTNCLKLCTENKVNQKNSWELNLIDYIKDVVVAPSGEPTNFQLASCTLDASVKIYSYRVDSIHSETYKVLGGLSRSGNSKQDNAGNDDEEGAKGTKRSKKHTSGNTIENNPASLNVKKFDLEFDVDPLFRQTSAAFDEGGARGLLLNHLSVQHEGGLVFDSSETTHVPDDDGSAPAEEARIDAASLKAAFGRMAAFDQLEVCPSLASFEFMNWTPSAEAGDNSDSPAKQPAGGLQLDMDAEPTGAFALGADEDSDYDNDAADFFGDDGGFGDMDSQSSAGPAGIPVPDVVLALNSSANEFSYFNEKHLQNWAGPSHWKTIRVTGKEKSKTDAPKKKKERFTVDFTAEVDWAAAFANSRAATTLSKATIARSAENTLLPEDIHYKVADLRRLFTKPQWTAKALSVDAADEGPDEVAHGGAGVDTFYNYDNANDVQNYCPDMGAGGDDDDDDDLGDAGWEGGFGDDLSLMDATQMNLTQSQGDDLVAAPRKVEKIDIHYEKKAKRINVKKLKTSIWSELTSDITQTTGACSNPADADKVTEPHSFASLVSDLPSKVPSSMAENLSVPIMFVCLLHLANEKELKISGLEGMDDLVIAQ